ncbi:cryptochrome/photolyase family protein [Cohnella boryungensis]|uniref:Cryptochrome/photolyase family protein n=1 Tax=Cohnella boryungensis TaxID=768479 RepID=A0ABV8S8C7_9BACL
MKLFIHRKDLRTEDLPALDYIRALNRPMLPILILDPFLLREGRAAEHSGKHFLRQVGRLRATYERCGIKLRLYYGEPVAVVRRLLAELPGIDEIVCHEDGTPYAMQRDRDLAAAAAEAGVRWTALPDQPLVDLPGFHRESGRSEGYKVFTPFYRKWSDYLQEHPRFPYATRIAELPQAEGDEEGIGQLFPLPEEVRAAITWDGEPLVPEGLLESFLEERLTEYSRDRDRYALGATSGISRYLNCGSLSVRTVHERLLARPEGGESWKRQLAWRDFYLYQSRMDKRFFRYERAFDLSGLSDAHFRAWAEARTGIPVVDAAMTELNETGAMPNRLRMVTAMFLTKNLLCPFPFGERYFRRKLADYDNTLNRGGWLWCSSLGFDAAPYFRIMNPVAQSRTHDPSGSYIRRWLPELANLNDKDIHLPRPHAIVDLKASRAAAIEAYRRLLGTFSANS